MPRNYAEAAKWYRAAADLGMARAQYNLGYMHAKGRGVGQDYVLAHMWYSLAAGSGIKKALRNRDLAAKRMTATQIAVAQKLAREWRAKHKKK